MKESKMNTLVDDFLGECESIISGVEIVQELTANTKAFNMFEFDDLRYMTEYLQSFVLTAEEKGIDFTTLDEFENVSVNLYQTCKYTVETLEESIQDTDVLNEFGYIRASVNIIRDVV